MGITSLLIVILCVSLDVIRVFEKAFGCNLIFRVTIRILSACNAKWIDKMILLLLHAVCSVNNCFDICLS